MNKRGLIALVACAVVLSLVNFSIYKKEQHLKNGDIAYLQLAPVDPRSLMQGDYMRLRFAIENDIFKVLNKDETARIWQHKLSASDGRVVVNLDEKNRATFVRIDNGGELADGEIYMRYRVRQGRLKFATNAYFFQEGQAKVFQSARYGRFRVDDGGELLLTSMYDEKLNKL